MVTPDVSLNSLDSSIIGFHWVFHHKIVIFWSRHYAQCSKNEKIHISKKKYTCPKSTFYDFWNPITYSSLLSLMHFYMIQHTASINTFLDFRALYMLDVRNDMKKMMIIIPQLFDWFFFYIFEYSQCHPVFSFFLQTIILFVVFPLENYF